MRETLGSDAERVHEQVDMVLDNEDGIIILIGPRQTTSYCHGFGLSGCQLELLSFQVDCAISALAPAPSTRNRRDVRDKHKTDRDDGSDANRNRFDRRYRGGLADRRLEGVSSGGSGCSDRRGRTLRGLQLARAVSASDP